MRRLRTPPPAASTASGRGRRARGHGGDRPSRARRLGSAPDPKPLDRAVHDALNAPPRQRRQRARDVHERPHSRRLDPKAPAPPSPPGRQRARVGRRRRPLPARAAVRRRRRPDRRRRRAPDHLRPDVQDRVHRSRATRRDSASKSEPSLRRGRRGPRSRRRSRGRSPAPQPGSPPAVRATRSDRAQGRRRAARRRRARLGRGPWRAAARRDLRAGPRRAACRADGGRRLVRRRSPTRRCRPSLPAGRKSPRSTRPGRGRGRPVHVRGAAAVQKRLDFTLAAPAELAGLPRHERAARAHAATSAAP